MAESTTLVAKRIDLIYSIPLVERGWRTIIFCKAPKPLTLGSAKFSSFILMDIFTVLNYNLHVL